MEENEENVGSIRDALEEAIDQHEPEEGTGSEQTQNTDQPVEDGQAQKASTGAENPSADKPETTQPVQASVTSEKVEKPEQPAALAPDSVKAPGTWNPQAREKWATLPNEVKQEVWKREREASRALTVSSEARRFQNEFQQAMQPYLGFIAAENSTPLQAVDYMMRTGAILRVGTAEQKANTIAEVIKRHGVDLELLDTLLAGQQPQNNPQMAIQEAIRQQLSPVMQMLQEQRQFAQQHDEVLNQEAATELEQFAASHEFYWDVKDDMAEIMELAMRRGRPISLTDAYDRATLLVEPVRRTIESRKAAETARNATRVAQNAKRSASSVTPSNEAGTTVSVPGDSLRAAIEHSIALQQGR
jgi:hypothetical protein